MPRERTHPFISIVELSKANATDELAANYWLIWIYGFRWRVSIAAEEDFRSPVAPSGGLHPASDEPAIAGALRQERPPALAVGLEQARASPATWRRVSTAPAGTARGLRGAWPDARSFSQAFR